MNNEVVKLNECDIIKCSYCERDLMIVLPDKKGKEITCIVQVGCPYCKDQSYEYNVKGTFKYHFAQGVSLDKYKQDGKKMKFLTRRG